MNQPTVLELFVTPNGDALAGPTTGNLLGAVSETNFTFSPTTEVETPFDERHRTWKTRKSVLKNKYA